MIEAIKGIGALFIAALAFAVFALIGVAFVAGWLQILGVIDIDELVKGGF